MKTLQKSAALLIFSILTIALPVSGQEASLETILADYMNNRWQEVLLDNEYKTTGYERGVFLNNPLQLDGKPLDYNTFNIASKGELTVVKGASGPDKKTEVPFLVYLRRNGKEIFVGGKERPDLQQTQIEISEILMHAQPGDHLIIEAVRKEDGAVKRILKLAKAGC